MKTEEIRSKLIANGVKNLHQFGYPEATADNILTDEVYSMFFESMLESNLGNGITIDNEINKLLSEIRH